MSTSSHASAQVRGQLLVGIKVCLPYISSPLHLQMSYAPRCKFQVDFPTPNNPLNKPPLPPPAPPAPPRWASSWIHSLRNSRSFISSTLVTFVPSCASCRLKDKRVGIDLIYALRSASIVRVAATWFELLHFMKMNSLRSSHCRVRSKPFHSVRRDLTTHEVFCS